MEKYQESKLHADYVTYKKYQNRALAEIRKATKSFEKKLSVNIKSDPKSFYAYEDSLALCQLSTLKGRRLRGDLIQAFKLLKGLDQIKYNNFFVLDGNTSRRVTH